MFLPTAKYIVNKYNIPFVRKTYCLAQNTYSQIVNKLNCSNERRRIRKFENIHANKDRCFIIGNGPSILKQDLTKLKDEIVFVANAFILHNDYNEIAPNYYCVSDPRFFKEGVVNQDYANEMKQKADSVIKFFPESAKRVIKKSKSFNQSSVYYLNYITCNKIWELDKLSLDPSKIVYRGDTVIIEFCLILAHYMGFKEIYLLGCECDFYLDKAKDYSAGYFYDVKKQTTGRQTSDYHLKYWYENLVKSYTVIKRYFEKDGCTVFNATAGGKLEVFERVIFEELFNN